MKVLFSHYNYLLNTLSQLAWHLGFRGNLSLHFCIYLNLKGRPIHPTRALISTPEMKKLLKLTQNCNENIFYFVKVLGI
jgi:hypothetical protein